MKNKILLITFMITIGMLAGCGKTEEQEPAGQEEISQEQEEVQQEETQQEEETESEQEADALPGFSFADVADREFYFSSGAGGWCTVLYIHEDGTFDGNYHDSDMGVSTPEYPNGTLYYCDFSGKFTKPEKVDDTTWVFQIESIEYPYGFGEEIRDGYHYYYTEAYGLDEAKDLYMYLPGAKIADLPEAYRSWVGYYNLEAVSETELPFYGLYNVKKETGFSSYPMSPSQTVTEAEDAAAEIKEEIQEAETKAAELEQKLQDAQNQADLNTISGEMYTVWDDALNTIWAILKENLDEESMKALTEEERSWISEKEAKVKEAGAEVEGGSMYAMIVNQRAAELTRERVYELAKYLP